MQAIGSIITLVALAALAVGVPLAILRSLDEIKERQQRIERRLDEIGARLDAEEAGL